MIDETDYRLSELCTPLQGAKLIETSRTNIYYWMKKGRLTIIPIGEVKLILKSECEQIKNGTP